MSFKYSYTTSCHKWVKYSIRNCKRKKVWYCSWWQYDTFSIIISPTVSKREPQKDHFMNVSLFIFNFRGKTLCLILMIPKEIHQPIQIFNTFLISCSVGFIFLRERKKLKQGYFCRKIAFFWDDISIREWGWVPMI